MTQATMDTAQTGRGSPPSWLAPVLIVLVVAGLIIGGRKRDEVIENPIVDIAILTVGVFAFAAAFRFLAVKAGAPGLATFFGASHARTSQA